MAREIDYIPGIIADPGPEIYSVVEHLSEENQRAVGAVVSEALGAIANVKAIAYQKIAGIIGGAQQS
jgi:hypothetical protein